MIYSNIVDFNKSIGLKVTSPYGMRKHPVTGKQKMHYGIDFGGKPRGFPLPSFIDGIVTYRGSWGVRGQLVVVQNKRYGVNQIMQHFDGYLIKPGDKVVQGTPIGKNGDTGTCTAVHLHTEFRIIDGSTLGSPCWGDPAKFFYEEELELEKAIVINSFADFPAVEPLAEKLRIPIYLPGAKVPAKTIIVCGGNASQYVQKGVEVVNLSGKNRWETARNIETYYKKL